MEPEQPTSGVVGRPKPHLELGVARGAKEGEILVQVAGAVAHGVRILTQDEWSLLLPEGWAEGWRFMEKEENCRCSYMNLGSQPLLESQLATLLICSSKSVTCHCLSIQEKKCQDFGSPSSQRKESFDEKSQLSYI